MVKCPKGKRKPETKEKPLGCIYLCSLKKALLEHKRLVTDMRCIAGSSVLTIKAHKIELLCVFMFIGQQ